MADDCLVLAFDNPTTTLPSRYVVQSGDTLTAIAKRFGFLAIHPSGFVVHVGFLKSRSYQCLLNNSHMF
jgi:hypothetical protein